MFHAHFRNGLLVTSTLVAAAALPGCAATAPAWSAARLQEQLATARTRADHEAIAAVYERQARDARSTAQEHRWQASTEQLHQLGTIDQASGRCAALAASLRTAAAGFDRLASLHRAMAAAADASPEVSPHR